MISETFVHTIPISPRHRAKIKKMSLSVPEKIFPSTLKVSFFDPFDEWLIKKRFQTVGYLDITCSSFVTAPLL